MLEEKNYLRKDASVMEQKMCRQEEEDQKVKIRQRKERLKDTNNSFKKKDMNSWSN